MLEVPASPLAIMAGKRYFAIIFRPIPILLAAFLFLNFLARQRADTPDQSRRLDADGAFLDDGDGRVRVYKPSNSTSNVAICLIIKNETLYLDEWIDYQVALGFSPIYIYDNSPDFELKNGLHSGIYSWYESREDIHDYIRLIHFPGAAKQKGAYDQCIYKDAANSTFAALFDADEFVVLKTFDNIVDFMDHHCSVDCGQLSLNWRMMGTSGEQKYTAQPVTKRNVHWSPYEAKQGTIKVIVRPDYVSDDMRWSHSVVLKRGAWLDTNGTVHSHKGWRRMTNEDNPTDVALLYHYSFKSEAEFHHKTCVKTRADIKGTLCNSKIPYGVRTTLHALACDCFWLRHSQFSYCVSLKVLQRLLLRRCGVEATDADGSEIQRLWRSNKRKNVGRIRQCK